MIRIVLFLALIFSQLVAVQPARAACVAGAGSGFSAGSAIVGNQVILCANSDSATSTTNRSQTVSTKYAKPVAAVKPPVCPSVTVTTAQIVAAALLGCKILGPSNPPAPVVVVKPKVTNSSSLNQQTDSAAFVPNEIAIAATPSQAPIFVSMLLTSNTIEHERTALVLGRTAYVRFVPSKYEWLAESIRLNDGAIAVAAFATSGPKQIDLTVSFDASYRFGLNDAWMPVGVVTRSASAQVLVTEPARQVIAKKKPRLVWASCQKHPSNYRC
ncbi:MAG: hypothetical protein KA500_02470 [Rhodoluna sp.]|nr:hypothetical protein [Rhodoluna sp.]MBP6186631.1 hypothetical protein [Rhodoluna sp.]